MASFLNNIFKKGNSPEATALPKNRKDMEKSFSIQEHYTIHRSTATFMREREASDTERKLLNDVLDILESVPAGKQLVQQAAQMDFRVLFDGCTGDSCGYENSSLKCVVLNPRLHTSAAGLAATFFHELTHAVQESGSEKGRELSANMGNYRLPDQLKHLRAIEAGAWAGEAEFAYAIKDRHPEILKMVRDYPMFTAYEKEMETSGDPGKAGAAAFKAWYNFDVYKKTYNSDHVKAITLGLNRKISDLKLDALRKELPNAEVLENAVLNPAVRREIAPDFLVSREALSLPKEQRDHLQASAQKYKKGVLIAFKADTSVDRIFEEGPARPSEPGHEESAVMPAAARKEKPSLMSSLAAMEKPGRPLAATMKKLADVKRTRG